VEWDQILPFLKASGTRWGAAALAVLLPRHCIACGKGIARGALCATCLPFLRWRLAPFCEKCGEPLATRRAACQVAHDRLAGLHLARAPFRYHGTGGALVRRIKFEADHGALRFAARAMAHCVRDWAESVDRCASVVSVPLHRARRKRRGIDQAAALADAIGERLGLQRRPRALVRLRATLPQGDPRVLSRSANVAGAFALASWPGSFRGPVLLVDDVCTSGSTARECARVLRGAGASAVVLVTAAQA
jgi:ComF family protein